MPSPVASFVFWAAVLCCVVAEAAIVRSTAIARRGAAAGGAPTGEGEGAAFPPARRGAELAWAVLPALALAGVLAWTWREMQRAPAASAGAVPSAAADSGRPPGAVP